ncbi:cingulin-like protein 1 [Platysternon megacephalum]|uniref:Cingulin-like protein 1 n=1 Tax=Platysternon megacephalum TaxID=55544 RepID=A0A4D9E0I2_9SAUR|nr:cingulin-like protein 1 [Platysternon megacephalum]
MWAPPSWFLCHPNRSQAELRIHTAQQPRPPSLHRRGWSPAESRFSKLWIQSPCPRSWGSSIALAGLGASGFAGVSGFTNAARAQSQGHPADTYKHRRDLSCPLGAPCLGWVQLPSTLAPAQTGSGPCSSHAARYTAGRDTP